MVAENAMHVLAIERFIGQKIPRVKLEGFNYKYTALFEADKAGQSDMPQKVRGVRLSGGYYCGPVKRRRR
jgi:hypothetical protein